jgi:hypothetical protein
MLNLNIIAGIAGCTVLLACWSRFRSAGPHVGWLTLLGCTVISTAVLVVTFPGLAGVLMAMAMAVSLLWSAGVLRRS